MSWSIDPPVKTRGVVVAAIVTSQCRAERRRRSIWGAGNKHPLAIVFLYDDRLTAVDPAGKSIDEAEFEKKFPNARKTLSAFSHTDPGTSSASPSAE